MTDYTTVQQIQPGDYVKVGGQYEKVASVYGVGPHGGLAKPSEGGFGVVTEAGRTVTMWDAQSYHKASEVESPAAGQ